MLSKIEMILVNKDGTVVDAKAASLMQGVLMEFMSNEYAAKMHTQGLRPYSQEFLVIKHEEQMKWTVKCLNEEAKKEIIYVLLSDHLNELILRHKDMKLVIKEKKLVESSYAKLFEECYLRENMNRFITFDITTPMAFKSDEKYINFPSIKLIFQSLIHRYDSTSAETKLKDDSLFDELEKRVLIERYRLYSTHFYLEGIKIPSFQGTISLKVGGNQNLVNLVNMLLKYGEYSGIGIKTAMGMGAIKVKERVENSNGKQES